MKIDRWNPYSHRQYIGHRMHKAYFDMLLTCADNGESLHSVDYEGHGCLDAPDEIPCGSTLCIHTIGGWDREAYNRQERECVDWRSAARAEAELAAMLTQILEETA